MRVIGGTKKGRKLLLPSNKAIRPMRDMVRMALFNILGERVEGSRFLDLFAGTGSVGIEALSRGAKYAAFVDNSAGAVRLIRKNLENLDLQDRAKVYQMDALEVIKFFEHREHKFDLIFIGPPYGKGLVEKTLLKLATSSILAPGSIVVTEIFKKETLKDQYGNLKLFIEREYGDNLLKFYEIEVGLDKT